MSTATRDVQGGAWLRFAISMLVIGAAANALY